MKHASLYKYVSLALVLIMSIAVFSGCGAASQSENASSSTSAEPASVEATQTAAAADPASSEKIELRLMTPWTAGAAAYDQIEALMETYKTEHPNLTIVHDALPTADARTKLTVEMAAGNPPDVSWCPLSYAREFIKGQQNY